MAEGEKEASEEGRPAANCSQPRCEPGSGQANLGGAHHSEVVAGQKPAPIFTGRGGDREGEGGGALFKLVCSGP